jgi:hypothetical protein
MAAFSQGSSHRSRGNTALCALANPERAAESWNLLAAMPSPPIDRRVVTSMRPDQRRTKPTIELRVPLGTQAPVRVAHALF